MDRRRVVGRCSKYDSEVQAGKADAKCLPRRCLYFRSYGEYPRRLKVGVGEIVKGKGKGVVGSG